MIREHERVVLTGPIKEYGLETGDIGTVVFVHNGGIGYEVEFVTLDGSTSHVVEVGAEQVRPVGSQEIPHVRQLAQA
ncbi:DUF4926 domain-containing protein [Haloferula sp. A504]|uniref:DUF4926 domain-containing protein n=1 Tax=Haloferula sp. A504 TaxID=3373601 RepID=UPI0031C138F7|nr:DUF4926 domain-containing protein [Verrucomicrobiaceae bacterium E54]